MDVTQSSQKEKRARARKMMLWFGMASLIMGFAGWTSAYIVSSTREDWIDNFELPSAFFLSTALIILSSFTYILALRSLKKGLNSACSKWLLLTLLLGISFIVVQFVGFSQLIDQGYYFTGPSSNITMSYIFLIAAVHIVHLIAGLISLLVVMLNHWKGKYTSDNLLGMELGISFWHFLDLLWVYLVLFFYFYR